MGGHKLMQIDRRTRRLYQEDPFLCQAAVRIVRVGPDYLELDATCAYPEGGGQESDQGVIALEDGTVLRFAAVRRMYGHPCRLPDFPDILVGGVIWHSIVPGDAEGMARARAGMGARVSIDIERRARLSISHTASHLLYLGVQRHRPDAIARTLGCHIREDGARFDFAVEERFTPEEIAGIEDVANDLATRDLPVFSSADPAFEDARRWHCDGEAIPCGGTHWDHTGAVGSLEIRRKRLGSGKERIACQLPRMKADLSRYHPQP